MSQRLYLPCSVGSMIWECVSYCSPLVMGNTTQDMAVIFLKRQHVILQGVTTELDLTSPPIPPQHAPRDAAPGDQKQPRCGLGVVPWVVSLLSLYDSFTKKVMKSPDLGLQGSSGSQILDKDCTLPLPRSHKQSRSGLGDVFWQSNPLLRLYASFIKKVRNTSDLGCFLAVLSKESYSLRMWRI